MNTEKVLCDRYIENDHGASRFWHSYIVYRVQNENLKPAPQPAQRRYRDIGLVAKRIWEETGADMEATIETLCWPALQQAMTPGIVPEMYYNTEQQPDLALLCAAAYLNLIPIAKRLLQEGHSPHKESNTFSSPMKLAAWAGNAQMLEIFQDQVPEMDGLGHIPIELVFDDGWRGKTGPDSINGAVLRGDIAMVRLAVYPPSRAAPDSTNFVCEAFRSVDRLSNIGVRLSLAQYSTRDVGVGITGIGFDGYGNGHITYCIAIANT